MTQRKPDGVTFESWIEQAVQEAQRRGEFDALPGAGQPLKDADKPYDEMWWVKGLMEREGLSFTPDLLLVRRELESLGEDLPRLPTEEMVRERVHALNARVRDVNLHNTTPHMSTVAPLELDDVLARWRSARARRR